MSTVRPQANKEAAVRSRCDANTMNKNNEFCVVKLLAGLLELPHEFDDAHEAHKKVRM